MPTSGSVTGFSQTLPVLADRKFIANTFTSSHYKSLNENVVGAAKLYLSAINGIGEDDVRLSKRRFISEKDYEVLREERSDQLMALTT